MSRPVGRAVRFNRRQLRRVRAERGLSQRAFSARIGFSPSAVAQVEGGVITPSLDYLGAVARAFRVDIRSFFGA